MDLHGNFCLKFLQKKNIELDDGKIFTGKPYIQIFDGKNPWLSGESIFP